MKHLISISNYRLFYKEAWSRSVGFLERSEPCFPYQMDESEVDVVSFFGEPFFCSLSILFAEGSIRLEERAYELGLALAKNRVPCAPFGNGESRKAFQRAFLEGEGQMELHLNKGLLSIFENGRLRYLSRLILANGGVIYSPYEPDVAERQREGTSYLMCQKEKIAVFGCKSKDAAYLEQALMRGSEIFIHTSSFFFPLLRDLAKEGATLFSSPAELIEKLGYNNHCYVYEAKDGLFHSASKTYNVLDLYE